MQRVLYCCLYLGGTDGVGKETAVELAKRGAKIIIPCRNITKGMMLELMRVVLLLS